MALNKRRATKTILLVLALVAAAATLFAPDALAQCAMCKASASNLDSVSARSLNLSTLILLCPPVAIFCAIIVVAYKHRKSPGDDDVS